ncbi:MAG: 5-(carboxyamino)imidazole ribonucleotide mutase [Bdellovibrionota bacterium]
MKNTPQVAIIMGSLTDYKIMKKAEEALKEFGIKYVTEIISAHRTPEHMFEFAKSAHLKGIKVVIAGAGGAAHLPGMVASLTPLPVIGVPVTVNTLNGLDALLSIVQMPKGVPVATVAIDSAYNAGLLAARILSADSKKILSKTLDFQKKQKNKIKLMNKQLK